VAASVGFYTVVNVLRANCREEGWTHEGERRGGRRETFILCSFKKGLPRETAVYQRQARCWQAITAREIAFASRLNRSRLPENR